MTEKKLPDWYGVSRDSIDWYTTRAPKVFRFDYETNKSLVTEPLKCKVDCVTCANTCPTHAIGFPSLSYLHKIIKEEKVVQYCKKEVDSKK